MTTFRTTLLIAFTLIAACGTSGEGRGEWEAPDTSGAPPGFADRAAEIERGRVIVSTSGCHDCHTPMGMTANGPARDLSRALSGHPEQVVMPPNPPLPEGPWQITMSATTTAFGGPWGTSFAANLTPDQETGTGSWTRDEFIAIFRTGRHLGKGRPILPPMPWDVYANYSDQDLGAVYAYLQSLAPIKNRVPSPRGPQVAALGR